MAAPQLGSMATASPARHAASSTSGCSARLGRERQFCRRPQARSRGRTRRLHRPMVGLAIGVLARMAEPKHRAVRRIEQGGAIRTLQGAPPHRPSAVSGGSSLTNSLSVCGKGSVLISRIRVGRRVGGKARRRRTQSTSCRSDSRKAASSRAASARANGRPIAGAGGTGE